MRVAFSYFQPSLNRFAFQEWVKISVIVKVAWFREVRHTSVLRASLTGFPDGSEGKESAFNAGDTGDMGLIPGSGRSPGEGNGSLLQCSCLRNHLYRGACWAEAPDGLQSMGLQRVGHDRMTEQTGYKEEDCPFVSEMQWERRLEGGVRCPVLDGHRGGRGFVQSKLHEVDIQVDGQQGIFTETAVMSWLSELLSRDRLLNLLCLWLFAR